MVGGYRGSYSRASSDTSEFARDESDDVYTEEERTTSSTYSAGQDYRSAEWTDEKHRLYLKSMEASFVDQLYNSLGLLGSHLKNENVPDVGSSRSRCCHGNQKAAEQFKVLRGGLWQRVNVKRPERCEHCFDRKDESQEFISSPWIKRYRPLTKTKIVASPRLEGNSKLESQVVNSNRKKGMVVCDSGSTASQMQICAGHSFFHEYQQINIEEEASDQNFIDEETNSEKASLPSSSKKMKIMMNESSSNDQVVPHGKSPAT